MSPAEPPDASGIAITSGVSVFTGDGFVTLKWGIESGQLTPDEARLHALLILGAAEAAEHDAVFYRWLKERIGMPDEAAAVALVELRDMRELRRG